MTGRFEKILGQPSFADFSKQIRQDSRSTRNRLHSILYDAVWVKEVQESFALPLIPNERCGLWYAQPSMITDTSYFKSTDGHITQWSFSTRRLNFHLLDIIVKHSGIIIVDSTRRGKTMPDALSKTIPIWCATLNYIMFGSSTQNNDWCFLPLQVISESEASSIVRLIPKFAEDLLCLQVISKEKLLEKFHGKYLRPIWVYPGQSLPFEPPTFDDFYPIVCCVASVRADDGSKKLTNGFDYVQGAADDHELWAANLTPQLFWENVTELTNPALSEDELMTLIHEIVKEKKVHSKSLDDVVQLTDKVHIGKILGNIDSTETIERFQSLIVLSSEYSVKIEDNEKTLLHYKLSCNKKGSNDLRKHLPEIINTLNSSNGPVLIVCESGNDLSVGVALAVIAMNYNIDWEPSKANIITKDVMKRHLARVLQHKKVNPSRATLQSINSFLM